MIDGDEGQFARRGNRLPCHGSHHHPADEPGAAGGRYAIEIIETGFGFNKRQLDKVIEFIEMRARCYFRHHTAIGLMFGKLRRHEARAHPALIVDNADGRIIATGLDTQNNHEAIEHTHAGIANLWAFVHVLVYKRQIDVYE
jgi:hypothetical protein